MNTFSIAVCDRFINFLVKDNASKTFGCHSDKDTFQRLNHYCSTLVLFKKDSIVLTLKGISAVFEGTYYGIHMDSVFYIEYMVFGA